MNRERSDEATPLHACPICHGEGRVKLVPATLQMPAPAPRWYRDSTWLIPGFLTGAGLYLGNGDSPFNTGVGVVLCIVGLCSYVGLAIWKTFPMEK